MKEVQMISANISHYHILEKLGGGGMGTVKKTKIPKLNEASLWGSCEEFFVT